MMAIIVGKNRVEYLRVKKKDLAKHFFTTRKQLYKVYPDALTPVEIYHNGVWVGDESIIVFEENGTTPYHCKYPKDYEMDSILASIDEHKLMSPKKSGFTIGSVNPTKIWDWIPLIALGCIGVYLLIGMI